MQHNTCADCGTSVNRRSIRCRSCAVRQGRGPCDLCGAVVPGKRARLCEGCEAAEDATMHSSCADCGGPIASRGASRCRSCVGKRAARNLTHGRRSTRMPRPLPPTKVGTLAMEHLEVLYLRTDGTFAARCTQCSDVWSFDRGEVERSWSCDTCDRAALARYRMAA